MKKICDLYILKNKLEALLERTPHMPAHEQEKVTYEIQRIDKAIAPLTRPYSRVDIIQTVIREMQARTYLEIGVHTGMCFSRIAVERKIGVDPIEPAPVVAQCLQQGHAAYYQMTSDAFFEKHAALLRAHPIDVAFVDGVHSYEQSLKDVEHCLKYLRTDGMIVLHDCYPASKEAAIPAASIQEAQRIIEGHAQKERFAWSGDVWKTVVHLRSFRKDLYVCVLACDCGLGIIMKQPPENMLSYTLQDIHALQYQALAEDGERLLNLKPQLFVLPLLRKLQKAVPLP